jgi:hydroxysqualene dehydroxylase
MTAARRIAIIGGGWAGLSCAAWLARNSLHHITVFEASPQFGGRARGLMWEPADTAHERNDQKPSGHIISKSIPIDNGQHLTIGAYRETFALLSMVGAPAWDASPLTWTGVSTHATVAQQWKIPNIGWPWRALVGLIPGCGPRGWPMAWKIAICKTLMGLVRNQWQVASITASAWLAHEKMPAEFIAHFWRPLCEGALNTELESASAPILVRVLNDALAGPRDSTQVFTPPTNLSVEGVDPITAWLAQRKVSLESRHLVESIQHTGDGFRVSVRTAADRTSTTEGIANTGTIANTDRDADASNANSFDAVVIALPASASVRLWDASGLPTTDARQRWSALDTRPITTAWIQLSRDDAQRIAHLPDWFILNAVTLRGSTTPIGQVVVKRKDHSGAMTVLGVVNSAHGIGDKSTAAEMLARQLAQQLGIDIRNCPQKWITEKQATWAATADAPIAHQDEALGLTGVDGVYRCADDLEPGYPATIESAVRSGKRTAATISGN